MLKARLNHLTVKLCDMRLKMSLRKLNWRLVNAVTGRLEKIPDVP